MYIFNISSITLYTAMLWNYEPKLGILLLDRYIENTIHVHVTRF